VLSNACDAKFSQYSTTDWFSNNCKEISAVYRLKGKTEVEGGQVNYEVYRARRGIKYALGRKKSDRI
jgi:hypothetical protein